ncbi:MAG: hypothetical protein GX221_06345 [Candidatus Riflebacteria bacterium]|nr:hypothetical protein [Candidatus Riflebacteria bacterium]
MTKNNKTKQDELYYSETHCPSCARFVGTNTRCPYCQADTQKRLSIRVFKAISVFLSTVGLLALLFYAQRIEAPIVKIGDLKELSNFGHVRIEGVVTYGTGTLNQWGSLSLTISEPAGRGGKLNDLRVTAYSNVAKELQEQGKLPVTGDRVVVEGQVRIQRKEASLLLNAPEHLTILERAPEAKLGVQPLTMTLQDITPAYLGREITVSGVVKSLATFNFGNVYRLDDASAEGFPVLLETKAIKGSMEKLPEQGDVLTVTGFLVKYQDSLEIKTDKPNSFTVKGNRTFLRAE